METKEVTALSHLEKSESSENGNHHSLIDATAPVDDRYVPNKPDFRFVMTMLGFSMAFIVAEVIPLFLVTCFTVIAFDLGAIKKVIWVLVAPYISTGAVAPFVGSLSDILGRRWLMLVSLGITVIAMIICAAAPSFGVFLLGQVISGIGIGMLLLTTISAASELVPVAKRGVTIGYIVLGFLPFASASLYGQLLTSSGAHGWRYIFVIVAIWAFLSMIVLGIFYHPPPRPTMVGKTKMQVLKNLDYVGSALSVIGLTTFLVGINWGGNDYPWNSVQVICALTFGIFTMLLFVIWEVWITKNPLFPMRLVQSKRYFIGVALLCFTSGINYVPLTVFWTIQTYTVYLADFPHAGIYLLPLGWCIAGGAIISAVLITVFRKHILWVLLVFCIIQTVGMGCMALSSPYDVNTVWAPMIFGLIGVGAVLLPSQVVFSVISPDDLIGTSVALSLVIRMIGQVVGKSMFYNIFRNHITNRVMTKLSIFAIPALQVGFPTVESIQLLATLLSAGPLDHYLSILPPLNTPEKVETIRLAGRELYKTAFPLLYKVSVPFGALACLSCGLLWGIEKYIDGRVAVHL